MATYNVLTPNTKVQIIPLEGCDNNEGIIVDSCLHKCCSVDTTGQVQFCETYTVRYMARSCTSCFYLETDFCRQDLIELPQ